MRFKLAIQQLGMPFHSNFSCISLINKILQAFSCRVYTFLVTFISVYFVNFAAIVNGMFPTF